MKKEASDWKRETARDLLALGSWVFYALVVVRAWILPDKNLLYQLIIAGAFFILAELVYRKCEARLARALALAVFTSLFYSDNLYTGFAGFVYAGLIASSYYSEKDWKKIISGIAVGAIAAVSGYYLAWLL